MVSDTRVRHRLDPIGDQIPSESHTYTAVSVTTPEWCQEPRNPPHSPKHASVYAAPKPPHSPHGPSQALLFFFVSTQSSQAPLAVMHFYMTASGACEDCVDTKKKESLGGAVRAVMSRLADAKLKLKPTQKWWQNTCHLQFPTLSMLLPDTDPPGRQTDSFSGRHREHR